MAMHKNVVHNNHFHKKWQQYVRCHFNQAPQAKSRRIARAAKAARIAPRPAAGFVRPVVRCQTFKYNTRVRAGRGFSVEEYKQAFPKTSLKEALTIGIPIDYRRRNASQESIQANVQRLKEYKNKLIVFPKSQKKRKEFAQKVNAHAVQQLGEILPVLQPVQRQKARAITEEEKKFSAFRAMRVARADAHFAGKRLRAAEAKKAEESMKKKEKE